MGPYHGNGFQLREQVDPEHPEEDFIIFESDKCGLVVGFYGNGLESIAVVDVPCKHRWVINP